MEFPPDIQKAIESFALVIDNSGNKSYVPGNKEYKYVEYLLDEVALDARLAEMGLFRRGECVYDPHYPYRKKPAGEKDIGEWYPAGKAWIPGMDRDIMNGHPAEKLAEEWMKAHPEPEDALDGSWNVE